MIDDTDLHKYCDRDITRLGRENDELKVRVAELVTELERLKAESPRADGGPRMTVAQRNALWTLCGNYNAPFREDDYVPAAGTLPAGWYEGWVGGRDAGKICVGVSPDGWIHS